MRFSLCTVFTLSGLLATTFANPVPVEPGFALQARGIEEQATELDSLQATIKELTDKINATMASVPADVSDEKAEEVKGSVEPILEKLKEALYEATQAMEAQSDAEASDSSSDKRWLAARSCDDSCLVGKSNMVVSQISGTIRGVVTGLGADRMTSLVKPVLSEVKGMLSCLDGTVPGLLKIGSGLVGSILGGCGLDSVLDGLLGDVLGDALGDILGGGDLGSILEGLLGGSDLLGGLLGGDGGLLGGLLGGGGDEEGGDDGGLIGGLLGKN